MKDAAAVWSACADDARWATDPEAMVAQILRQGFEAGVEASARCIARTTRDLPAVSVAAGAPTLARAVRALLDPEPEEEPTDEEAVPCDSAS